MRNLKHHPVEEFTDYARIPTTEVGVSADSHHYVLPHKYDADANNPNPEKNNCVDSLRFIHLDKDGKYTPGVTDEQLLEVLINRTEYFQRMVPCPENEITLNCLKAALRVKLYRTELRQKANVEGTHIKH